MQVDKFLDLLNADFYTGIPDSQLKSLCDYLNKKFGPYSDNHIIAANEGNCVAIAAGYHMATGKTPIVYMQNSGIGNAANPIISLTNDNVYAIPCIYIIGWRGEPGIHDEPQHIYQGKVTIKLLEDLDIQTFIVGKNTSYKEISSKIDEISDILSKGKSVAFVIKKDALIYNESIKYENSFLMSREEAIAKITEYTKDDIVVSTTGKASRELFEIREENKQSHAHDFLTVGSMGHSSSIALGIAINKKNSRVWCIDGDGAALMHMGALAVIGAKSPKNMIHVVINNLAHETVGGMPTVSSKIDFVAIAKACNYPNVVCVDNFDDLDKELASAKNRQELSLIEIKCSIDSRANLGRPTTSAIENKLNFMEYLKEL